MFYVHVHDCSLKVNYKVKPTLIFVVLIGFLHKDDEVNKSQYVFKDQISELF